MTFEEERDQLLAEWYLDDKRRCYDLFPDTFTVPFSSLHDSIFEKLYRSDRKRRLILAPRGLGKTSLCCERCAKAILYREKKFIVYISNSLAVAEMQTENIKANLLASSNVRKFFGNVKDGIKDPLAEDMDDSFSKKAWVAFGETIVLPRGQQQQIRGLNWKGHRPDLIIFDDPEDMESLSNENNRKKFKRWMLSDVMQATSRVDKDWEVIYIDTLKHEDAMPVTLMSLKGWDSTRLEICDDEYKSAAPDFMSDAEIMDMVEEFRSIGSLDVFFREYRNIPVAPETAAFRSEYFRYYKESDLSKGELAALETIVLVDPAKSLNPSADKSAIVGIGIDKLRNRFYVRDIYSGRIQPDVLYDEILNMVDRLGAKVIGLEVTSLNEFITFPFYNELSRRGMGFLKVVELKPRAKKEDRIKALVPLYRTGLILHNEGVCGELESQLVTYPQSQYDDVMDATAYLVEMADVGKRFMLHANKQMNKALEDDEYDFEMACAAIPQAKPYELEGLLV